MTQNNKIIYFSKRRYKTTNSFSLAISYYSSTKLATYSNLSRKIIHKKIGPALIYPNKNNKFWVYKDQYHRFDGPTIIVNENLKWYFYGAMCKTEQEYWNK